MLYTKEFYDIMNHFEKTAKNFVRTGSQGFKREEKENWTKGWYYSDGQANESFKLFLQGVSFGKVYYNE